MTIIKEFTIEQREQCLSELNELYNTEKKVIVVAPNFREVVNLFNSDVDFDHKIKSGRVLGNNIVGMPVKDGKKVVDSQVDIIILWDVDKINKSARETIYSSKGAAMPVNIVDDNDDNDDEKNNSKEENDSPKEPEPTPQPSPIPVNRLVQKEDSPPTFSSASQVDTKVNVQPHDKDKPKKDVLSLNEISQKKRNKQVQKPRGSNAARGTFTTNGRSMNRN